MAVNYSLVSLPLVFDHLQYAKMSNTANYQKLKAGKAWERGYHSILQLHHSILLNIVSSGHSPATESRCPSSRALKLRQQKEKKSKRILEKLRMQRARQKGQLIKLLHAIESDLVENGAGETPSLPLVSHTHIPPPFTHAPFTHASLSPPLHTHTSLLPSHMHPFPLPLHTYTHRRQQ